MTAKQVSEFFSNVTTDLALASRDGLPDALRVLLAEYPRAIWETDPGFDGLIRFWLDRHMMFRRVMVDMQEDARRLVDAKLEPAQYASRLSRYGGMFVNGLHEHHTIEDTHQRPADRGRLCYTRQRSPRHRRTPQRLCRERKRHTSSA
jgi:hypothetical protein